MRTTIKANIPTDTRPLEPQSNLLTIRQAAKILNVHPDTLRRWERQGKIESIRIGSRKDRRYKIEDIYSLISLTISDEIEEFDPLVTKPTDIATVRKTINQSKLVLFDLSDTLMIPFPSRGDIYANVAFEYGYNLNPEAIEENFFALHDEWEKEKLVSEFSVFSTEALREKLFAKLNTNVLIKSGIPSRQKLVCLKIAKEIYEEITGNTGNWRILPDVRKFLSQLRKQDKTLGILDNWNIRLHEFVNKSGLGEYFDFVISGGEENVRKPDKRIFEIALNKAKNNPTEAVYIGNRYIDDVLGPLGAGITPILFDRHRNYIEEKFLKFYRYRDLLD